jgi:hypothetical protein
MYFNHKKANGVSEHLYAAAAKLDTPDLEAFLEEMYYLHATRIANVLGVDESTLLKKIADTRLSNKKLERFRLLQKKSEQEALSRKEQEEWLELVEEVEKRDTKRLQLLGQLARLRKVPLRDLVKEMGLKAA